MTLSRLFAVALALTALPGCPAAEQGSVTTTWKIQKVDGTPVGCNASFSGIVMHVMSYTKHLGGQEEELTQLFDCAAGSGTMTLPLSGDFDSPRGFTAQDVSGKYDVWISQTDSAGEVARQTSKPVLEVDLTTGDKSVTNTLYEDGGYWGGSWDFFGTQVTERFSCAASGVEAVKMVATNVATNAVTTSAAFPCDHHADSHFVRAIGEIIWADEGDAETEILPMGEYSFVFKAFAGGVEVGTSDPEPFTETIRGLTADSGVFSGHQITLTSR
jgi:hypothetical protein